MEKRLLITKFEIERELAGIDVSDSSPLTKTKRLLKLARRVRHGQYKLNRLVSSLMSDCMGEQAARMHRAANSLGTMRKQIRDKARRTLAEGMGAAQLAHTGQEVLV